MKTFCNTVTGAVVQTPDNVTVSGDDWEEAKRPGRKKASKDTDVDSDQDE